MHEGGGCADVSPNTSSVLAFKPRQVLLVELQRSLAEIAAMERKQQLKSQEDSILICSIALWLENKGLSKVLKRFISATQIQDDEWKARALNLDKIFSNYLDSCDDVNQDNTKKKLVSEGIVSEKKKKKIGDVPAIDSERTSEDAVITEKVNESNLKLQSEKNANGARSHGEQKSKTFQESTMEKVCELMVEVKDETVKKEKDKKKKDKSESTIADEKPQNAISEVTKGKQKDLLSLENNGKHDSEVIVEAKDKKKKKKMKRDDFVADNMNCESGLESKHHKSRAKKMNGEKEASNFVELTGPGEEAFGSEKQIDNTYEKKSAEAAGNMVNDSKKCCKKRKGLDSDENEKLPILDVAVQEPKRRKTKGIEPQITLPGANGHVDSQYKANFQVGRLMSQNFSAEQTGEIPNDDPNNAAEKLSHPKSVRKQDNNSAEPKTVNAFQRVKIEEVKFVDERLQDNSYWAKDGAENGYGAKAQEILGQVKGRGFRHEKTKKKRGSYRGGLIDVESHSIKFNYSDDE